MASAADRGRTPGTSRSILSDSPCGGKVPLVRVWERSLCPTHWLSSPVCLLNAGLVALGAGTPPQGTNVTTPPKRLLARGRGLVSSGALASLRLQAGGR